MYSTVVTACTRGNVSLCLGRAESQEHAGQEWRMWRSQRSARQSRRPQGALRRAVVLLLSD